MARGLGELVGGRGWGESRVVPTVHLAHLMRCAKRAHFSRRVPAGGKARSAWPVGPTEALNVWRRELSLRQRALPRQQPVTFEHDAIGVECSRVFPPGGIQQEPNTWKAMTTNAKAEYVPSFWKKCWNAFVRCFKRDTVCTCSTERQSITKVEEPKPQEKKAAA